MKIDKAPKLTNPVMIDRVLACIQDALIDRVGWLDYAFGRAQRLVTKREQRDHYYPGVYIEKNEYLNVLPGQGLGNRTFFMVDDPYTIDYNPRRYNTIRSPFSLVLWYDIRTILGASEERNTEEIKRQILRVLTDVVLPGGTRIELTRIYETAENIYKGYSLKEIDTQFLMHPFGGLRIEGTLIYREECL